MSADESTIPAGDLADAVIRRTRPILLRFEGFRARPYLCPGAVWTIGYGSTVYTDATPVGPRDAALSEVQAWHLAEHQLRAHYLPAVMQLSPGVTNPRRLAALTSFVYNVGVGAYRTSTLRRRVSEEAWGAAAKELGRWVYAAGQKLPGLVTRRGVEALMLVHPDIADRR